ncbi:hypothetical protein MA16_Dca011332 [Dendrobium catenatum]|uniref:Uncharacterized protein n=1 Tax=Dendrobium catenatum TaxID=906689 RepID=A0A2I0WIR6_9ASPA|nr:hypothetical protein MA16_Dca011332 [Dendrobium catenatum]
MHTAKRGGATFTRDQVFYVENPRKGGKKETQVRREEKEETHSRPSPDFHPTAYRRQSSAQMPSNAGVPPGRRLTSVFYPTSDLRSSSDFYPTHDFYPSDVGVPPDP